MVNSIMKLFGKIAIILVLVFLCVLAGCITKNKAMVPGLFGDVVVNGDIDEVSITDYSIFTKEFNNTKNSFDMIEGVIFSNNVVYYSIEGYAINNGLNNLDCVNISVKYFRDISKGIFYIGEKYHNKYSVEPGETWKFSMLMSEEDEIFGPIESIEFVIDIENSN